MAFEEDIADLARAGNDRERLVEALRRLELGSRGRCRNCSGWQSNCRKELTCENRDARALLAEIDAGRKE